MNIAQSQKDTVRYSVTIALLMAITLMSPSMRAAYFGNGEGFLSAAAVSSVAKSKLNSTVAVRVIGDPKLELAYDLSKNLGQRKERNEASLTATSRLSIDGGAKGQNVMQLANVVFTDKNGKGFYVNSYRSNPMVPKQKVSTIVDKYGATLFVIPAGKKIDFDVSASVDPRQLFAGTYRASVSYITVIPDLNSQASDGTYWSYIQVPANQTNAKTIVGEVGPYITSVAPDQVKAGEKITISGQRLNDISMIYIDGVAYKPDAGYIANATTLEYTLPSSLASGWHSIQVYNANGMSNRVGFEVLGTSTQSIPVTIINDTSYSTTPGIAFLRLSMKGYPTNNQVDHWVLSYACITGVTVDTGKSLLCNGVDSGKSAITYYRYNMYDATSDYLMLTANAENSNSANASLWFALDARNEKDMSLGNADSINIALAAKKTQVASAKISNTSTSVGAAVVTTTGVVAYPVAFNFTLTAPDYPIYISSEYSSSTDQIGSIKFATTLADNNMLPSSPSLQARSGIVAGDGASYYIIPAGTYREFSVVAMLKKENAKYPSGLNVAQISEIDYKTPQSEKYGLPLYEGLENLKISVMF